MNNITMEKAIEIGVQAGVKEALERIRQDNKNKRMLKKDRRLRNTELLLKNYNGLLEHYKTSKYTQDKIETESPEDPFEEMEAEVEIDEEYETIYINSIKRTKARTKIMLDHIEKVVDYYEYQAKNSENPSFGRRYKIIVLLFFQELTWDETAEILHCSKKTISRDRVLAVEELSVLFFGVDGLKFYM